MNSCIQTTAFDVESVRTRLRNMNDAELLRFGRAAKYMCTPYVNIGKPPREEFVMQLREARGEWRETVPRAAVERVGLIML
jgi:hypothetical protein